MASVEAPDPREQYAQRLSDRRRQARRLASREEAISWARLGAAAAAAGIAWMALSRVSISFWWLMVPAAAFVALLLAHERVIRARRRFERAASHYERGLDRLAGKWAGRGEPGTGFLDEEHLYAADLDLFGPGSLFELICTARTRAGQETLAAWLKAPADRATLLARQEAVQELRSRLDLREDLALLGADLRAGAHPAELVRWASEPAQLPLPGAGLYRFAPVLCALLSAHSAAGGLAWALDAAGPSWFAAALMLQGACALRLRPKVLHVIGAVESAGRDLALLSQVLERLERERFTAARLVALREELEVAGSPPSRRIARLGRLIDLLDARRNQLFSPLGYVLMWATQLAHAIESWRAVSGPQVGRWLAAVGEMEALSDLAGYAWENPQDPFAEIVEGPSAEAFLEGEALGHPLLPRDRCVTNDARLGGDLRALIVSGSNMSGKSTMLRTVGTNVVLAQAGAPVRARRLRLSPLAVGASIRIHDSLQAGTSRFYAEITRLRRIVDLAGGPTPALFLVDEMLHGTNSHDRLIGAEAVVLGLVRRGAVGMITTHDLALSRIAESLNGQAANVHFEDHLEQGRMTFDYRMRPGVVARSNALALMRSIGLDVGPV